MIKLNGKLIVDKIIFCKSILSKCMGLRFKKSPKNMALVFYFANPQKVLMDMWFVFYPIDVVFLDSNKMVVELKKGFKPFSFYHSKTNSNYIIEFEQGMIKAHNISVGDVLDF